MMTNLSSFCHVSLRLLLTCVLSAKSAPHAISRLHQCSILWPSNCACSYVSCQYRQLNAMRANE